MDHIQFLFKEQISPEFETDDRSFSHYLARNILTIEKSLWYSYARLGQRREKFPPACLNLMMGVCEMAGTISFDILVWILSSNDSDPGVCRVCLKMLLCMESLCKEGHDNEKINAISRILETIPYCPGYLLELLNEDMETVLNVLKSLQDPLGMNVSHEFFAFNFKPAAESELIECCLLPIWTAK